MLPTQNVFSCFLEGGKFFKIGRRQVTTRDSSLLAGALEMNDVVVPLVFSKPWEVDSRPFRNQVNNTKMLTHRPRFDDWKFTIHCVLDHELVGIKMFRQIVDMAGRVIGLGDYRPDRKGPYGKFVVECWEEKRLSKQKIA